MLFEVLGFRALVTQILSIVVSFFLLLFILLLRA